MARRLRAKRFAIPIASAVALSVSLIAASSAWAPPAPEVPNMGVSKSCVVFGHKIPAEGFGFAPGSTVILSAPLGHYIGPPGPEVEIKSVSVTADQTGNFSGFLWAPKHRRGNPWAYEPRVIVAKGTEQGSGEEGESFDEVLVGTALVCKTLSQTKPHGG